MAVKHIPDGFHTITPHITVHDAANAIEFYKKAFGAEEVFRIPGPGGKGVMHAEIKIGDCVVMLNDEMPQYNVKGPKTLGGSPFTLTLYVRDCDAAYKKAVDAGAKATMPLEDMFWGDRYGKVTDPFGHHWAIATHKEDVPAEELGQRAAAAFGG